MGTKTPMPDSQDIGYIYGEKRIPKHGDENALVYFTQHERHIACEKRIPKHGDENKGDSPFNIAHESGEKRIPKHGDENYGVPQLDELIVHCCEKRIPKHGDENFISLTIFSIFFSPL